MATLRRLLRWLERQPLQDKESLTKLAHRGWFLGPRMSVAVIPGLASAVEGMPKEVDLAIAQHVRRQLDHIEAAVIESYPLRAHLFQEAFSAHRESKYGSSILIFLQQADGIFYDTFGSSLYTKGGRGAVSGFRAVVTGQFFQAVLYPFTVDTPLWVHTGTLDDTFEGLNRHQVVHGLKVNYDTELNSLKAISLLDNLVWVLNRPAT